MFSLFKISLLAVLYGYIAGQELRIAWLAPKKFYYAFNASSSVGALVSAIEKIKNDTTLLNGVTFNVTWRDSDCNSKTGIGALFDIMTSGFDPQLILGPACSPAMAPVGQLASLRNIPVFGWISSDPPLKDKTRYSTLVRFLRPISSMGEGFVLFFEFVGWKLVFLISTTGGDYGEMGRGVRSAFVARKDEGYKIARWVQDVKEGVDSNEIRHIFQQAKREARIIVLCIPDGELRQWMLAAAEEEMVAGDYVFIFTEQFFPEESRYNYITSLDYWRRNDTRDGDARRAYQNLFIFTTKTLDFLEVRKYKSDFYHAASQPPWPSVLMPPTPSDFYSLFLHDAMMVYARAATEAGNITDGRAVFNKARGKLYKGGATGDVILDDNADRIPDFWIFDMRENGRFAIVAETVNNQSKDGKITRKFNELKPFLWGNGDMGLEAAPKDRPDCGFDNENCPYGLEVILIPSIACALLIVIIIVGVIVMRKISYEKKLKRMVWRIMWDDMAIYTGTNPFGSQLNFRAVSQSLRKSRTTVGDDSMESKAEEAQVFTTVANYKGAVVAIKKVRKARLKLEREQLRELKRMFEIKHGNMTTFVGACIDPPNVSAVWEYCSKGSLQDVIWNENINLDEMFKYSISIDMLKGLVFLHNSHIKVHANLKSSNVVIDGRWTCKLTDFGLIRFTEGQEEDPDLSDHAKYNALFWTAPEILKIKTKGEHVEHTPQADVYSIGVILKETFARNGPYSEFDDEFSPQEIIERICNPDGDYQFGPALTDQDIPDGLAPCIRACFHPDPGSRPSLNSIMRTINRNNPFKKASVMDNMIAMMEKYSNHLEDIVAERTVQLEEEKKKTETLLYRMLPKSVAEDLKQGKPIKAEAFDNVSIYFSDIVKFTNLAGESTPLEVVNLLNSLYTIFDETISHHDVYKVETIGDAYMLVSGLPTKNGDRHVVEIVNCAMDLLSAVMSFKVPHKPDYQLRIRIGLHSGSCVAGVVGLTMPRYCLFGDTVNIAARMESGGSPMRIHMSESCYNALSIFSGYYLAHRGDIEVKGKGQMQTYWIVGKEGYRKQFPNFDQLAVEDSPKAKKLPMTKGKDPNPKGGRPSTESGFSETVTNPADSRTSLQCSRASLHGSLLENSSQNINGDIGKSGNNTIPDIHVLPPLDNCEEIS